jgi:hypothetical protein
MATAHLRGLEPCRRATLSGAIIPTRLIVSSSRTAMINFKDSPAFLFTLIFRPEKLVVKEPARGAIVSSLLNESLASGI